MQEKKLKKIFFISLIFLINFSAKSQNTERDLSIVEFKGKVLDSSTNLPVAFAHVINVNKSIATITDTTGYFRIVMLKSDTIKISSIGYEIKYFILPDSCKSAKQFFTISINPTSYQINTIDIYDQRWKAFVYDVSTTKIKEDETQQRLQLWFDNLVPVDELVMLATAARGFGFPLNYKTSIDKQLAKVEELKRQAELDKIAEEKFNIELVGKITKLEGDELVNFMQYCNFDRSFILKRTEYDLIVIVMEIFEIYKEDKLK